MKISEKHLAAIDIMIDTQFERLTKEELASRIGVTRVTLYRWLDDEDFQEALRDAKMRWRKSIEHIPFVHRRVRLEELVRLYNETPDSYIEKFLKAKARSYDPTSKQYIDVDANIIDDGGKVLRDDSGEPVSVVAVRKLNVDTKSKLLSQIAEEVGGDVAEELEELQQEVRGQLKLMKRSA